MKKTLVFLMLSILSFGLFAGEKAGDIESFITKISTLNQEERKSKAADEFAKIKGQIKTPETEGNKCTFLYFGEDVERAEIIGDINSWEPKGREMARIAGTDIFYLTLELESDAIIKYKLKITGKNGGLITDPLNPDIETSPFGTDSIFKMPGYSHPEILFYPDIPHGKTDVIMMDNNTIFGKKTDKRKIQVYLPPHYDTTKKYRTIYIGDGSDFYKDSKIPNILDYMIDKNEMEEVVAVFIDWLERDREFINNTRSEFKKYILEELMPMLEIKYSLRTDADGRVFAGASNGGVFATYIGATASDKFGYILNYSGYPYFKFGGDPGFGEVYKTDNLPIRIMTITGKYERRNNVDGAKYFNNILNKNPNKIPNKLVFYPQGHTFRMWGDAFREGIMWLLYNKEAK